MLHLTPFAHCQDEYKDASGTVITMDFYNASALLPLPDDALVARCQAHLAKVDPLFKGVRCCCCRRCSACVCGKQAHAHRPTRNRPSCAEAKVVDSVVLRCVPCACQSPTEQLCVVV